MALGWRDQYNRYRGFFLNIVSLYKQRADLRAFTEVILSITTITVFLIFALKPTALTIIALAKEINEKKQTVIDLDKKISDLQKASTVYAQNQTSLSNIETAVSTDPHPDTVSSQIAALATKDSVRILGLSIGQVYLVGSGQIKNKSSDLKPLPGGALEMPISINITGNYQSLTAFIKDLENLRTVTKVDLVGIGSSENNGERVIVALISARIPYLQK